MIDQVWERFLSALEPLWSAGRLSALLFQFPPWFGPSKAHREEILECKRRAAPYPICVEFRNAGLAGRIPPRAEPWISCAATP